ncbi:MAG: hypothetical protein QOE71_3014, partial [Pseudonocardiales bacterium]|nr:hypothetical protein [Pseudonocardiales bacterium]
MAFRYQEWKSQINFRLRKAAATHNLFRDGATERPIAAPGREALALLHRNRSDSSLLRDLDRHPLRIAPMSASSLLRSVRRALLPALSGLLAGAAGLSVAQLIAQFIEPNSSPVIAVGGAAIDATPTPLKEYAIRNFGTNDKHVLLTGILAVLALLTMAIGIAAARRFIAGIVLVVALGVVAVTAELRRPNATAAYPISTLTGLACALGLLYLLIR